MQHDGLTWSMHALRRWHERFPGLSPNAAAGRARRGIPAKVRRCMTICGEPLYDVETGAVLVLQGEVVVTVLDSVDKVRSNRWRRTNRK